MRIYYIRSISRYSKKSQRRLKEHFKLICSDRIFEKIGFPENDFHVRQPHTLIDVGCILHLNSKRA